MSLDRRRLLQAVSAGALLPGALAPAGVRAQEGTWAQQKRRAVVRGLEMAYHEAGEGTPIVFLHGNPTSSYLWRNVIPHVSHLGRCIAPDLVGMGDSDPLPDSGPDRYTYLAHREHLFGLLEQLGVSEDVVFVAHDWGSALVFDWAQQYPERVRGLAYAEMIMRLAEAPQPEPAGGLFALLRSPEGEQAVLEENVFVEQIFLAPLQYYLTDADRAEYRRPYREPGESRRPTLAWPRELPLGERPEANIEIIESYTAWLAETQIPKLFFRAMLGAILNNEALLEHVRGFPNQREVTVYGPHYVQEVSPHAMGRALAAWIGELR